MSILIRTQLYRPCLNRSCHRCLNSLIAQSEESTALSPSLPNRPIPTSAQRIIGTSFAPSPMAKVTISGSSCFISLTTSAFSRGLTLQQMTVSRGLEIFKNHRFIMYLSSAKICFNAFASIIKALRVPSIIFQLFIRACYLLNNLLTSSKFLQRMMSIQGVRSFEENPILSAVSSLSPVSTHILISPFLRASIVSGTLSCSLSSTTVAPRRTKFLSNLLQISSNSCFLVSIFFSAARHYFKNLSTSS